MSDPADARTVATRFYDAFARGDGAAMAACYSPVGTFRDEVFGLLTAERAGAMWRMLTVNKPDISYDVLAATATTATVNWVARYEFGPDRRPVVNHVRAVMTVIDGRIVEHIDTFDAHAWVRQAIGGMAGAPLLWRLALRAAHRKALARLAAFDAASAS